MAQSVTWYQNGTLDSWNHQEDVFAFRCVNGQPFTGTLDMTHIDTVNYWADRRDMVTEICFKPTATATDRDAVKNAIRSNVLFEVEFPVVTKNPGLNWTEQKWYVVDDLVLVNFLDPNLSMGAISSFMARNNLLPYHEPSMTLPNRRNHVHVFKLHPAHFNVSSAADVARNIMVNEAAIVDEANPNFSNIRLNKGEIANNQGIRPDVNGGNFACETNDPYYAYNWHIENDGTFTYGANTSTPDADADICECWDRGLTGKGIKIAIIGYQAWEFSHPDMDAEFALGWDCTVNPCTLMNPTTARQYYDARGFHMAGIMGANNDNNIGGVGIATDAWIMPFLVNEPTFVTSWDQIVRSFQIAIDPIQFDADIVAIGLWETNPNSNFSSEINTAVNFGRVRQGSARGVVMVAPTEGAWSNTGFSPVYPADHTEVIGVIPTNPNDRLKTANDGWDFGSMWVASSTSGDVAAPGALITNVDITTGAYGSNTTSPFQPTNRDYFTQDKANYPAVAVVAGTVALLMQADPLRQWNTYHDALQNSADDVGGYVYTNSVSNELAHGRINCNAAVNWLTVGIADEMDNGVFSVSSPAMDELTISWDNLPVGKYSISIIDVLGRELNHMEIIEQSGTTQINVQVLTSSPYFVRLVEGNGNSIKVRKFIKL